VTNIHASWEVLEAETDIRFAMQKSHMSPPPSQGAIRSSYPSLVLVAEPGPHAQVTT